MATKIALSALLTVATVGASVVPVSADPAHRVNRAASIPRGTTFASLQVLTLAARAGQKITFGTAGSRLRSGTRLGEAVLNFGDGASTSVGRLGTNEAHAYRKAGRYTATLLVTDSGGARSVSRRTIILVASTPASLRKTTARVAATSLLSLTPTAVTAEVVTLRRGTKIPSKTKTLLIGKGRLDPQGLIAVVTSVKHNADGTIRVAARDGSLGDAYSSLTASSASNVGQLISTTRLTGAQGHTDYSSKAVPFSCTTKGDHTVNITVDLSKTDLSTTIDLRDRIFQFELIARPVFSLGVDFSGSASCSLSKGFSLDFPIPSVPGLVVAVGPYFDLTATGTVSADASWHPALFVDITRSSNVNDNLLQFNSSADASATGSASVTLEGGLDVTVSEGKAAGLEVKIGPAITATASTKTSTTDGNKVCVVVTSEISAEIKLFAHIFFVNADVILYDGSYDKATLLNKCAGSSSAGGSGSGSGASTGGGNSRSPGTSGTSAGISEVAGAATNTWTDYAHAGGTRGQTVLAGASVSVSCRTLGFQVSDGNTWWYRISSSPWNDSYYTSADAFYNNGTTSGSLRGTPFVDTAVPTCPTAAGDSPTSLTPPGGSTMTPVGIVETTGGATHTWTDYVNAGGTQGPDISAGSSVVVGCRTTGFKVTDSNTWWYQIASSPWGNTFYASADAFYNNGATSGSLRGTPYVDPTVPVCSSSPAPGSSTYAETTGGVTHTWTNYSDAGGTQGPSIPSNATEQIACRVTGLSVADGDTWWYRIASSPWNEGYYASADAFYNNGATSGSLSGTPFVDAAVPVC